MNNRRSQSARSAHRKSPNFNKFSELESFLLQKRSFSNPKYRDILKQRIKNREKRLRVDLSQFKPVKLNFQRNDKNNDQILSRNTLRSRIIKSFK